MIMLRKQGDGVSDSLPDTSSETLGYMKDTHFRSQPLYEMSRPLHGLVRVLAAK